MALLSSRVTVMPYADFQEIRAAATALRNGELVVIPTETVYGLAADATNALAVARIFELKQRPRFNPLIIHVKSLEQAQEIALDIPSQAEALAKAFWPGPLSLVLRRRYLIPDIAAAGLPTIAVRCPAHPVTLRLLEEVELPLAAPSANLFTGISPTSLEGISASIRKGVAHLLEGGDCAVGVESTILDLSEATPRLLRHGGLPVDTIEAVIGKVAVADFAVPGHAPKAPGMLARHYAPQTPCRVSSPHEVLNDSKRRGLLCLKPPARPHPFACVEALSKRGDLKEAAARLFRTLTFLDHQNLDEIIFWPFPDEGLGRAINDRLKRAATP